MAERAAVPVPEGMLDLLEKLKSHPRMIAAVSRMRRKISDSRDADVLREYNFVRSTIVRGAPEEPCSLHMFGEAFSGHPRSGWQIDERFAPPLHVRGRGWVSASSSAAKKLKAKETAAPRLAVDADGNLWRDGIPGSWKEDSEGAESHGEG